MKDKGRRRKLAQYFTPQPVAAFALDALIALGLKARKPRVIDPACGEAIWLAEARQRFPGAEVWGCDLDQGLAGQWRERGLDGPRAHMLVQDGLLDAALWSVGAGQFDLAIGNPPYGLGLARPRKGEPIEALFVRRFVALLRPGGWLAVVVPEGVVANARTQPLRDWLRARLAVRAVVALPDSTFAAAGTAARTALLLARRGKGRGGRVLLASPAAPCRGPGELAAYLGEVLAAVRRAASDVPPRRHRGA